MAHNDSGHIYGSVNTDDVAAVLGYGSHDVGTLILDKDNQINPASKFKPVRVDTPASLTVAERRKQWIVEDQVNTYYGVRLATDAKLNTKIHEADYRYYKPKEGDWLRLDDFRGYNDSAKFNPNGTIGYESDNVLRVDLGADEGAQVDIEYYTPEELKSHKYDDSEEGNQINSTSGKVSAGIDLSDVVNNIFGTNLETQSLNDLYPCVLVSVGSVNKATALRTRKSISGRLGEEHITSKLYNNGVRQHWYIPFGNEFDDYKNQTARITVFFVTNIGQGLVSGTQPDLSKWLDVGAGNEMAAVGNALTCPYAVNVPVKLFLEHPFKRLEFGAVTVNGYDVNVSIYVEWDHANAVKGHTYLIRGSAYWADGSDNSVSASISLTYNGTGTQGGLVLAETREKVAPYNTLPTGHYCTASFNGKIIQSSRDKPSL